jgi:hypothetical protein
MAFRTFALDVGQRVELGTIVVATPKNGTFA